MNNKIGCLARFSYYPYIHEVDFAIANGFDFLQIQYDRSGLLHENIHEQAKQIKDMNFPGIIHAILDINEIDEHAERLVDLASYLMHKQIIIHPICRSEKIISSTIYKLSQKIKFLLPKFEEKGIVLFLENNSKLDPVFTTTEEVRIIFSENPSLEFVLDIAHIDNYVHLQEMVTIKRPKLLHITDRKLEEIHHHVPIGEGNIDFDYIFRNILVDYTGNIIIEIYPGDNDIIFARDYLLQLLKG